MPIYEYSCPECDCLFEEWQTGFEERTQPCPECGTESKRVISNTTFVLKGSGWYVTDYASKKPSPNGKAHSGAPSGTNGDAKDTASSPGKDPGGSSGASPGDSPGSSTGSAKSTASSGAGATTSD